MPKFDPNFVKKKGELSVTRNETKTWKLSGKSNENFSKNKVSQNLGKIL